MPATAITPAPLVPMLRDAVNKNKRHLVTSLYPGDQLHTTAKLLGYPKGHVLPIYGYCALLDEDGQPYQIRAYVRPLGLEQRGVVAYTEREAVRFRFEGQREQWFGTPLLYLLELCLTDHADCLRLERVSERVAALLPAATTVAALPYRQAA